MLAEALKLDGAGVVSCVGAGGKTTIMFRLANELAARGKRVLTTTTTQILVPGEEQSPHVFICPSIADLGGAIANMEPTWTHITAAAEKSNGSKLRGFTESHIEQIEKKGWFDWIIVEADGAAGKPLKAPASHEPVVPSCSCRVVGVIGLDSVGNPLTDRFVHRSNTYSKITGLAEGKPVTALSIAHLIAHPDGLFKGCPSQAARIAFFNKADTVERIDVSQSIIDIVAKMNISHPVRFVVGAARDAAERAFTIVEV